MVNREKFQLLIRMGIQKHQEKWDKKSFKNFVKEIMIHTLILDLFFMVSKQQIHTIAYLTRSLHVLTPNFKK